MLETPIWGKRGPDHQLLQHHHFSALSLILLHFAPVLASATSASLMTRQLLLLYNRFLIIIHELKCELLVLPPNLFNRFLLFVFFACMPSIVNALFYVLVFCVKFERFSHYVANRWYSLRSNSLVKSCVLVLSSYVVFFLFVSILSVIIRQLADSLISLFIFPFLVFSSFSSLFFCCHFVHLPAICSAFILIWILWWLAQQPEIEPKSP